MIATERIVAAALQHPETGRVFTLPAPARHCDVMSFMRNEKVRPGECRQGFVTSSGRFVDRRIGYRLAEAAGQLLPQNRPGHTPTPGTLYTEDLW